ncbi:MAG TPA: polysaccharide deacetylase family protein [Polyangiaceae bacterium]|nr:polysaccharide deacetylase family protein [Polyangiaceae bacterium]
MSTTRRGAPELPALPERRRRGARAPWLAGALLLAGACLGLRLAPIWAPKAAAPAPTAPSRPPAPRDFARVDLSAAPAPAEPAAAGEGAPNAPTNAPTNSPTNPEASVSRAWLLAEGPEPQAGDGRRYVTFTFDDGPFVETTPAILRVLDQRKIRASFFVVGQYLEGTDVRAVRARKVLADMARAGHVVGNHTLNHKLLTTLAPGEVASQIDEDSALIAQATGAAPRYFRPPFGQLDGAGRELLRERGLELVLWSVEAEDMRNDDAEAMAKRIEAQLERNGGGVVLLHDIRPATLPTLKLVLAYLYDRKWSPRRPERYGYQIVDLPTYLARTQASPRPYQNREELENARRDAARLRRGPKRARPARPAKAELVL